MFSSCLEPIKATKLFRMQREILNIQSMLVTCKLWQRVDQDIVARIELCGVTSMHLVKDYGLVRLQHPVWLLTQTMTVIMNL